ncbi:cytochrome P450 [Streptomyces sp. NPDC059651]|uniref:cytochrome P450 n=1 Tax=unclassified Streptomyces TaxID=2593676 RepID=UPI00367C8F7F
MTIREHSLLMDLLDAGSRHDPYPLYAQLREKPIPMQGRDGVVVGDYDTCASLLRDPRLGTDRSVVEGEATGRDRLRPPTFLSMNPPDHTRLRGLVSKAFTPKSVTALAPNIQAVIDKLLTKALVKPEFDFAGEIAYTLPLTIISDMLGVPHEDMPKLERWSRAFTMVLDPVITFRQADDSQLQSIRDARDEFANYFAQKITERRADPQDDLLTRLVQIEESGDTLNELEVMTTCGLLLVAGHETTASLTSNALLALLRHPDQLEALRRDPSLIEGAVEETLRWDPPVQITARTVNEPARIAGHDLPPRAVVLILLAAANRDPAHFERPDDFDITRERVPHLAFAAGIHFCLGAPLARLEAALLLRAFAERVEQPRLIDVEYRSHVNVRGPKRLIIGHSGATQDTVSPA